MFGRLVECETRWADSQEMEKELVVIGSRRMKAQFNYRIIFSKERAGHKVLPYTPRLKTEATQKNLN